MRKALVLMMTTCILFAGCIGGLTGEVEEVVESLTPECNNPSALNYDENGTNTNACITEEILVDSIGSFSETMDSEDAAGGFVMTMSGDMSDLDEGMGMDGMDGEFTIVSTSASNSNAMYSSTEVKMNGMTVLSQSWMGEGGDADGMVIQADTADGEFLMNSAMSWEDFLADADGQMSDDSDEEPDAAWFFLNIDTDSNNLVTWDEVDDFVIEADGGWESDEERDEVNQDFNNSDSNADGFLDENEFEFFFAEEDDGDDMDDSDDMDDGMDMDLVVDGMMDGMFSMFDGIDEDCDASMDDDCGFPEGSTVVLSDGMDGFTFSTPVEEGQTMDMTFDCDFYTIDVNECTMTGFSMDMEDGSEMVLEILSADEVAALLTIDTTLGYEALPFSLEEEEVEDVFICDDGEEIPADWENDGMEDCADGSDEEPSHNWESYENGYCEWEGNPDVGEDRWSCEEDASLSDWDNWWYYCELHDEDWFCTDEYGQDPDHENSADNGNYNESNASEEDPSFVDGMNWDGLYPRGYCEWEGNPDDVDEDRWSCKGVEWDDWWYYCENHDVDWHCTDDKGQSADYEHSANGTEWSEPEIFVCDNGDEIPMSSVNDGWDDCGDNSDEGVEEQEEGPLNRTFTVTTDAEFAFAGSFDDYSIVLANCVEETDDMGETTLTCDEDNSTMYALAGCCYFENFSPDNLGVSDSDSSGTLTNGDTIMIIGNTSVEWTHVRLHSTSADAYSDENPLHQLPGFTAMLGVLSLMGAAMMGRRD